VLSVRQTSTAPTPQNAAEGPSAPKKAPDKHMWRDMSESWLGMIGFAEQEDFAAEEHERGTNQQRSKSSH
jgi:hypothetical protein